MRQFTAIVATIALCIACAAPTHARRMLSEDGDTVETARQEAIQALQQGGVDLTISTVGFDIDAGSDAESYLQQAAQIGGGQYFSASDSGQLTEAMGAAATGQAMTTGVTISSPQPGDRVPGGRVTVTGTGKPGALIVVSTEARAQDDDELLRDVPGSRHKIEEDGTWQVWVAAPQLPKNIMKPMYYLIKAHWVTPNEQSETTTVKVFRADQ